MQRLDSDAIRPLLVRLGLATLLVLVFREPASAGVNRWTSLGPSGGYVQDLAVDPSDASRIFAATPAGLFRTTDSGLHWLPTAVPNAVAVAVSASDPNVVYTNSFRSGDGGLTWAPMGSLFGHALHIAVDPSDPRIVHAGFVRIEDRGLRQYHAGVMTSRDGGETWTIGFEVVGSDFFGASAVAVITDAARPDDVYAAVYADVAGGSAVYTSSDRGQTWRPGGWATARFDSLALGNGPVLYAGTSGNGVLTSGNGGETWHPAAQIPPDAAARVATDPRDRSIVYASTDDGLYRTTGAASGWSLVNDTLPRSYLLVDPASSTTLYSWGTNGGVQRSNDSGEHWNDRSAGLNAMDATAVAVDPSDSRRLYAGGDGSVWRSADGGTSWNVAAFGPLVAVSSLLVDPHDPAIIYAATGPSGLFRSRNAGETWEPVSLVSSSDVYVLTIAASPDPGVLYAGTLEQGAWKSTDFGSSWRHVGPVVGQVSALVVDPAAPSTVWAGTGAGLYRSIDAGETWALEAFPGQLVYAVTVADEVVWAAPYGELWHRADDGVWVQAGIARFGQIRSILVDPGDPSLVTVVADIKVYQTRNGGLGFVTLQNGLGDVQVADVTADPSGRRLYAATRGRGIASYERSHQITVPAAASLHGAPPTYFHSDVDVINTSPGLPATLTARYSCFVGACEPSSVATATIPPRGLARFEDIVGSLFEAPESGGALELESSEPIVVTSRLYSPAKPAPTLGMFVPGLYPEDSHPRNILTSLAHSSGANGSRTNIGVFNPDEIAQTVRISLMGLDGSALGQLERTIPAGSGVQINDPELAEAGLENDSDFVAIVEGDPRSSVYAYAAVIDNQSQDPIFVYGRDAASLETTVTLPAAASLHGAGGTFFHSDVVVSNIDSFPVAVVLDYRCFPGSCVPLLEDKLIVLDIGQSVELEDVVATTFDRPESGGAVVVEANGSVVATSRLYTPSQPQPTVGMFVPGLSSASAATLAILGSLSSSRDLSKGSRVNVGAFNGTLDSRLVTFRLFDASGVELGSVEEFFGGLQSIQLNDIFTLAGVSTDVPAAYCTVEADRAGPLYPYAAVIDNQSQDPIFVPGQIDPSPPR